MDDLSGESDTCYTDGNDCLSIVLGSDGSLQIDFKQFSSLDPISHLDRFIGSSVIEGTLIDVTVDATQDSCANETSIRVLARLTPECTIVGTVELFSDDECTPTPFTIELGGTCPTAPEICVGD